MSDEKPKAPKAITGYCNLDGNRWKLKFVQPADLDRADPEEGEHIGECDPNTRTMKVAMGLDDQQTLYVCLHEALHAAYPGTPEKKIVRVADWLTRVVWQAGFRHPHLKSSK